jgi:DNA-binding transcriptional regulator YiaG
MSRPVRGERSVTVKKKDVILVVPPQHRKFDKAEREYVSQIAAAMTQMREGSGLTLQQLAKATGASAAALGRAETGVKAGRIPNFDQLRVWSKAMGWQMQIVFCEPGPDEKWVQLDKPARKKTV